MPRPTLPPKFCLRQLLRAPGQRIRRESPLPYPISYSSFWGHSFQSRTDALFNWVRADLRELVNNVVN